MCISAWINKILLSLSAAYGKVVILKPLILHFNGYKVHIYYTLYYTKVIGVYTKMLYGVHATDLPKRRSLSEERPNGPMGDLVSFQVPGCTRGQLATSLFTAGHPLEIRNGFTTATNVFITDSR